MAWFAQLVSALEFADGAAALYRLNYLKKVKKKSGIEMHEQTDIFRVRIIHSATRNMCSNTEQYPQSCSVGS